MDQKTREEIVQIALEHLAAMENSIHYHQGPARLWAGKTPAEQSYRIKPKVSARDVARKIRKR